MVDLVKRVHYFDHQFLRVEDFTCEQDYHMARRRLHNRLLHTPGIAQGLEVEYDQDESEVTIRPGTAVDSEGQEIVLTEVQRQALPDWEKSQEYWLTIAYHEEPTNPTEETGVKGDTRWTETPDIKWLKNRGQKVVLAQVRRSDDQVTLDSSEKVRTVAGAKLGETTARKLTLTRDDVDSSKWPALSCGAAKRIDLSGSLSVRGTLKADVTVAGLIFKGEKQDYVEIREMNPNYPKGFTVEAWVCYHSFRSWSRIIDFGNGDRADNIVFSNQGTTNDLAFQVYVGEAASIITASGALEDNTWMHLVATVDANGQAALYKNGQWLVEGPIKPPESVERTKNFIGRSNWDHDDYFDGKIAEVRIWNHVRTEAEIKNDMNSKLSGSEDGLVGYWPCDDGSGEKVRDLTPMANHGTTYGAQWFQEDIRAMTITGYGNVGIGTTSPEATLDVRGTLKAEEVTGRITPHYDSGWISIPGSAEAMGTEIPLDHNLGVIPSLVQAFVRSDGKNDGSALTYPDDVRIVTFKNDMWPGRDQGIGFAVRAVTETSIKFIRGSHLWHGILDNEYFNSGKLRVLMWR